MCSKSSIRLRAPCVARINSSNLSCNASVSRFCVFWIRNTIKNVTIVVPVLITSCHVSLYPNIGPVAAQMRTVTKAIANAIGLPEPLAVHLAKFENHPGDFFCATRFSRKTLQMALVEELVRKKLSIRFRKGRERGCCWSRIVHIFGCHSFFADETFRQRILTSSVN
jgi:hypothetical protein